MKPKITIQRVSKDRGTATVRGRTYNVVVSHKRFLEVRVKTQRARDPEYVGSYDVAAPRHAPVVHVSRMFPKQTGLVIRIAEAWLAAAAAPDAASSPVTTAATLSDPLPSDPATFVWKVYFAVSQIQLAPPGTTLRLIDANGARPGAVPVAAFAVYALVMSYSTQRQDDLLWLQRHAFAGPLVQDGTGALVAPEMLAGVVHAAVFDAFPPQVTEPARTSPPVPSLVRPCPICTAPTELYDVPVYDRCVYASSFYCSPSCASASLGRARGTRFREREEDVARNRAYDLLKKQEPNWDQSRLHGGFVREFDGGTRMYVAMIGGYASYLWGDGNAMLSSIPGGKNHPELAWQREALCQLGVITRAKTS